MKISKVILALLVLLLFASPAFAAPYPYEGGGAVNPPGQSTYTAGHWSFSDCIMWAKEEGYWNDEAKPNEFLHWWLFGGTE